LLVCSLVFLVSSPLMIRFNGFIRRDSRQFPTKSTALFDLSKNFNGCPCVDGRVNRKVFFQIYKDQPKDQANAGNRAPDWRCRYLTEDASALSRVDLQHSYLFCQLFSGRWRSIAGCCAGQLWRHQIETICVVTCVDSCRLFWQRIRANICENPLKVHSGSRHLLHKKDVYHKPRLCHGNEV
jgi:hypothetical protein